MIKETLIVADSLEQQGISAEVIDVATIKPLDIDTILASLDKTGRIVVIHEAVLTCGVGADIVAQIAERGLFSLKAPPMRVAGFDTVVPYARLEKYYIPTEDRIMQAVNRVMEYT
jgi:pyruvate dehydrogenase E1 component beta subunit